MSPPVAANQVPLELKSSREIQAMRRAGLVVWLAHQRAAQRIRPGVTTAALNDAIRQTFREAAAEPLFLNYPGPIPFPAESCISVNEELVHGIPGPRILREGDLVSIDTGCRLGGWCGDAAVTHAVGPISRENRRLLDVTLGTLHLAMEWIPKSRHWSDVARRMGEFVRGHGFHVVTSMVGHGIGRNMHEPPQVPNFHDPSTPEPGDFELRPGLVIAVEPMVNVGTEALQCQKDQWTQSSADRSSAAHFEHTLAITREGVRRLTGPPEGDELKDLPDWLGPPERWCIW